MQSQGITLSTIATSWAGTPTALVGLTKISLPKIMREWVDNSTLDSADNYEEGEKGLFKKTPELECEFKMTSTRYDALKTLVDSDSTEFCKIVIPGVAKFFWFQASFLELDPGEAVQGNNVVVGKFKVKLTGKLYFQTAAPT